MRSIRVDSFGPWVSLAYGDECGVDRRRGVHAKVHNKVTHRTKEYAPANISLKETLSFFQTQRLGIMTATSRRTAIDSDCLGVRWNTKLLGLA